MQLELEPIETKRLLLRPVEMEDASDLFAIYGDGRVVDGNASMTPFHTIDDMVNSIKTHFFAYRQKEVPQSMALELLETGKVIGVIDFHTVKNDIGELGYMLAYDYWNHGYMKEAIAGMIHVGFEQVGFHRIEAMADPNNIGSNKVLCENGFYHEGTLRQYIKLNDNCYHDLNIYSILKEEYQEEIK